MPASFYMKKSYKSVRIGSAKNRPTKVTRTDFTEPVAAIGSAGGTKKAGRARTVDKLPKTTPAAGGRKRKTARSKNADKPEAGKTKVSILKDFNTWLKENAGKNIAKAYNKLRDQVLHRYARMGKYMDQRSALYRRLEGLIDKGELPTWKQAQDTATRNRAIAQMLNFLNAKSTTKKGYTDTVKKREEKLKGKLQKYGADEQEASDAIENLIYSGLLNRFIDSRLLSSDQVMKLWAMAGDGDDASLNEIVKALEDFESGELTPREAQEKIAEEFRRIEEGLNLE